MLPVPQKSGIVKVLKNPLISVKGFFYCRILPRRALMFRARKTWGSYVAKEVRRVFDDGSDVYV